MPFDGTRSISGSAVISGFGAGSFPISTVDVRDRSSIRGNGIQHTVDVLAVILFGAFGALAGAAVVLVMLVALVIPTTTTLAMAGVTAIVSAVGISIWLKRRAAVSIQADETMAVEA